MADNRKSAGKPPDDKKTAPKKAPAGKANTKKSPPPSPPGEGNEMAIRMGQRLRKIRISYRLTQAEMASSLGIASMTYNRYEWGWRMPDAEFCAAVVKKYKVDASWLLFGNDAKTERGNKKTADLAQNYELVPVYDLSTHKGRIRLTGDKVVDELYLPKTLLTPDTTAVFYHERNMIPTVMPGAIVGVLVNDTERPMGHVYAVYIPGAGTCLYRAYMESANEITLRSDNLAIPDIKLAAKDFSRYALGRMIWVFQSTI